MKKPLLFIDSLTNVPYDATTPKKMGLGGTQQSIIKVVEKLGEKIPVVVCQHNQKDVYQSGNVTYSPILDEHLQDIWENVILLRVPSMSLMARDLFKSAKVWLWSHDYYDTQFFRFLSLYEKNNIGSISVSDFHRNQIVEMARRDPYLWQWPNLERIYNPIDDHLLPDGTEVDENKLVFTSSHQKGLDYNLKVFEILKKRHSKFELFITHPGYLVFDVPKMDGVHFLGSLTFEDSIAHVRNSFCQLSLNVVQPETFGLVYVEANAVGTPVITHPLGAAAEVLENHEQLVNCHDVEAIIDRIMDWKTNGRPQVKPKEKFRISNVIKDWEKLLGIGEM